MHFTHKTLAQVKEEESKGRGTHWKRSHGSRNMAHLPCFVFFLLLLLPDALYGIQWDILVLPTEVRLANTTVKWDWSREGTILE